jgi:LysM repeat protein
MRRLVALPLAVVAVAVVPACATDDGGATDTLPPIRTTSTTSTTTTIVDTRTKFYEVEPGDSLKAIADRYCITTDVIVELNGLEDDGNYLEVGQILELPTDIVLVNCSAYTTTSTSTSEP